LLAARPRRRPPSITTAATLFAVAAIRFTDEASRTKFPDFKYLEFKYRDFKYLEFEISATERRTGDHVISMSVSISFAPTASPSRAPGRPCGVN